MPKGPNQKAKILFLMRILNDRTDEEHPMTIAQIIEALGEYGITAERKSLYDDIEVLRYFGVDIVSRRDKTHGYYVASRDFELPELKILVDAVQSSKFITHKKSNELIKKIEGLASSYGARELHRQVYVANRIKNANESIYYTIDEIYHAIGEDSSILFKYSTWLPSKERLLRKSGEDYKISPWALCWDDESYYLIGYDEQAEIIKHFRVDKMLSIRLTNEKRAGFERFKSFDMGAYSKKMFGMFNGKEDSVTLVCDNSLAGVIIDRFGNEVTISSVDNDTFRITVRVAVSPQFFAWVFSFGDKMRIVAPKYVTEEMLEHINNVKKHYS
ncbi:MAG: WYL domain-containing protein [Eubacteriales bacterium]|nr:WYL domain-containing protein [Eubacteriales bacterium]